jgi:hypothetical protein
MYNDITYGVDRCYIDIINDIEKITGLKLEILQDDKLPEGMNGHIAIRKSRKDNNYKSLIFTFTNIQLATSWLLGFRYCYERINIKPAVFEFRWDW